MKKLNYTWIILLLGLTFWGCKDNSTNSEPPEEPSDEKQFVWNAMNYWYYWQSDVSALADDRDDNEEEFWRFLNGFSDSEALFESLFYAEDEFSFFIDDYEEYQDEQDGIQAALGFNYGFFWKSRAQTELVGYVRYVLPGTPADDAGLDRLTLFTKVDGTTVNGNNFLDILTNNTAHDLTVAHIDTSGGNLSFVEDSTVSISSEQVIENPIFESSIIDTSGIKIGYLMYNAFRDNYHSELNTAFDDFKSQSIDNLVLDLRYNGGGSVLTSQMLASMISGLGSSDKFGELTYNEKRTVENRPLYFLDVVPLENEEGEIDRNEQGFVNSEPMNRLSLNKLYVLTSSGTASASETTINSLRPYINVEVIGLKTIGKDVGSLTFYDAPAPYLDVDQANPDHKKAIQPIVTKIVNSDDQDYPDGFSPDGYTSQGCVDSDNDNCVPEITVENLIEKPALGDPEEPLLARAISLIIGQPAKQKARPAFPVTLQEAEMKNGIQDLRPHGDGMYLEPFMMPTKTEK